MKKRLFPLFLLVSLFLTSCASPTSSFSSFSSSPSDEISHSSSDTDSESINGSSASSPYIGYSEYLKDVGFKKGFIVSSNINGSGVSDIGRLPFIEGTIPDWHLAQWGSRYNIMDNAASLPEKTDDGESFYSEFTNGVAAKKIKVGYNGSIMLELNASMEYDAPRTAEQTWPHLLIAQDWNWNLLSVARAKDVRMIMDFSLDKFTDHMGALANRSIHAAQFVWYVTLQNRNPDSDGYGEYLWFGLNLFDNRVEFPPYFAALDGGTSAFIYQPDAHSFRNEPIKIEKMVHIDFPLLDYAKTAFDVAKARKYLKNTSWSDIYIGGMNTGFEIPGTYDIAVTIYDLSIKYKY